MAQINPVLGDLEGNSQLILGAVKEALVSGADVVLFSEMVLSRKLIPPTPTSYTVSGNTAVWFDTIKSLGKR